MCKNRLQVLLNKMPSRCLVRYEIEVFNSKIYRLTKIFKP